MSDNPLQALTLRVLALEARVAGMVRRGPVEEVDTAAQTVRLKLGEGADGPYLSPPIPYAQHSGALKAHIPPRKGQSMVILSESGDFKQGVAMPSSWSDADKSPGDTAETNVITFGGFTIGFAGDVLVISGPKVRLECGGSTFDLSGDGLRMSAPDYQFD
ncbi:phage baseplate assembly protein V [Pararhizobium haloflavum]|uniref:phage baseplate assembly protein V n=1 Tax=Pararhizobium haloflavum TaxID=2037914 RepID=UPI000C1A57D8|nr:phage baseplate assembly protein V [Pararhizobium haloflavum]